MEITFCFCGKVGLKVRCFGVEHCEHAPWLAVFHHCAKTHLFYISIRLVLYTKLLSGMLKHILGKIIQRHPCHLIVNNRNNNTTLYCIPESACTTSRQNIILIEEMFKQIML